MNLSHSFSLFLCLTKSCCVLIYSLFSLLIEQVEVILAFEAFAMWKVFPIIREYIPYSTASSLSEEARLVVYEEMGAKLIRMHPYISFQKSLMLLLRVVVISRLIQ